MKRNSHRNNWMLKFPLVAINASLLILNAVTGLYYLIPINLLGLCFALGI